MRLVCTEGATLCGGLCPIEQEFVSGLLLLVSPDSLCLVGRSSHSRERDLVYKSWDEERCCSSFSTDIAHGRRFCHPRERVLNLNVLVLAWR